MRMSAAVFIRSDRSLRLPEGLVLFLFFGWGAAAAGLELFDAPALPGQRLLYSLFLLAVLLFAASDLILSGTYFGEGKDRPVDIVLNYLTYYPAQYLIAFSLAFV